MESVSFLLLLLGVWAGSQLAKIIMPVYPLIPSNLEERVLRIQEFRRSEEGKSLLTSVGKEKWCIDRETYDLKDILRWKDMEEIERIMLRSK
jgi:hypothetical protein